MVSSRSKLLIFDEPSTGLDPQTKRVIWSMIKDVSRSNRLSPLIQGTNIQSAKFTRTVEKKPGIIITSHDMNELDTICDQIQIMSAGQIVAAGTALELKNKFGAGYTLTVLFEDNEKNKQYSELVLNTLKNTSSKIIDQSGAVSVFSIENNNA